jgi:hypothetical protein
LNTAARESFKNTIIDAAEYLDTAPEDIHTIAGIYIDAIRQALYRVLLDSKKSKSVNYIWAAMNSSGERNSLNKSRVRSTALSMNLATRLIPDVIGRKQFNQWIESSKSIEPSKSSALFKLIFADCFRHFMIARSDLKFNYSSILRFAQYLVFSVLCLLLLAFIFN